MPVAALVLVISACGEPTQSERQGKLDGKFAKSPKDCEREYGSAVKLGYIDFSDKGHAEYMKACRASYAATHGR